MRVETSTESDEYQPARAEDKAFSLADTLTDLDNTQLEQVCEKLAQNEVDSSAYEGIPLDKESLKAGLLVSYKKMRDERVSSKAASRKL